MKKTKETIHELYLPISNIGRLALAGSDDGANHPYKKWGSYLSELKQAGYYHLKVGQTFQNRITVQFCSCPERLLPSVEQEFLDFIIQRFKTLAKDKPNEHFLTIDLANRVERFTREV